MNRKPFFGAKILFGLSAVVSLTLATALPSNAAVPCAASPDRAVSVAAVAQPQVINWQVFETGIATEAKCWGLMQKMMAAYPPSYHWTCVKETIPRCPSPLVVWTLMFGENNI